MGSSFFAGYEKKRIKLNFHNNIDNMSIGV
ncbi:hypothetical protein G3A_12005 [Bacillus sp. 17376]|nr:hypothetical protein G3A_12005 [Bacillus sp. 17376]